MGTDIHWVWQIYDERWQNVETKLSRDRDYVLFAWLADVRNGYGFASIRTNDVITPISQPRGMPSDIQLDDSNMYGGVWMGDHSHSWLDIDEILIADIPEPQHTGYVERSFVDDWDGKTHPKTWCGDVSGGGVYKAESIKEIKPETTHVRINFGISNQLDYFVDECKRLREHWGVFIPIRVIFGFDS